MQGHEILDEREADAGALVRARPRPFDPMEAFEDPRQLCRRDADARILDQSARAVTASGASATRIAPSNVNLNAFESRLRTIFSHICRST